MINSFILNINNNTLSMFTNRSTGRSSNWMNVHVVMLLVMVKEEEIMKKKDKKQ